jgi:hypothetical protein
MRLRGVLKKSQSHEVSDDFSGATVYVISMTL